MSNLRYVVTTDRGYYRSGKSVTTPDLNKAKLFQRKCDADYRANDMSVRFKTVDYATVITVKLTVSITEVKDA